MEPRIFDVYGEDSKLENSLEVPEFVIGQAHQG